MDMFYMYVIPGFSITNESQSNFVVRNIKFVFQNLETHPFYFWSTLFTDPPFYWQNFWPNPFYKFEISFTPPFLKGGFHTVLVAWYFVFAFSISCFSSFCSLGHSWSLPEIKAVWRVAIKLFTWGLSSSCHWSEPFSFFLENMYLYLDQKWCKIHQLYIVLVPEASKLGANQGSESMNQMCAYIPNLSKGRVINVSGVATGGHVGVRVPSPKNSKKNCKKFGKRGKKSGKKRKNWEKKGTN